MSRKLETRSTKTGQVWQEATDISPLVNSFLHNLGLGICVLVKGKFVYVNPLFEKLTGHSLKSLDNRSLVDIVHPDDCDKVDKSKAASLTGRQKIEPDEYRVIARNGKVIWVLGKTFTVEFNGHPALMMAFTDLNSKQLLEEARANWEKRYRTVIEQLRDIYIELDLSGYYTYLNDQACRYLGHPREHLSGKNYMITIPPTEQARVSHAYHDVFTTGEPVAGLAHSIFGPSGQVIDVETSISLNRDDHGDVIGFQTVSRDVTERKLFEKKLQEMATHDFLTGLPNLVLLHDRLELALAHARRNSSKTAVLTINLDDFKAVNINFGHDGGDRLLKITAGKLKDMLRATDTVARIGGDEFVLILQEAHKRVDITLVIDRILHMLRQLVPLQGKFIRVSASIGAAVYPGDSSDADTLLKCSGQAMQRAKKQGNGKYSFYKNSKSK